MRLIKLEGLRFLGYSAIRHVPKVIFSAFCLHPNFIVSRWKLVSHLLANVPPLIYAFTVEKKIDDLFYVRAPLPRRREVIIHKFHYLKCIGVPGSSHMYPKREKNQRYRSLTITADPSVVLLVGILKPTILR